MKKIMNKNQKGFTLVELIAVISLLLVLSVLAIVAYSNITDAARRAALVNDANTVARALNSFNSVVDSGDRVLASSGFQRTGDVFHLNIKTDGSGNGKGPVDLDLSVTVGPNRAGDIVNMLEYTANNMWIVSES